MLLVRTRLGQSAIHGLGVFASDPIPQGTRVWRMVPEFDRILPAAFALGVCDRTFVERYMTLSPRTGEFELCVDNARFLNHSDEPNLIYPDGALDQFDAGRDIAAGEELTLDYRIGDAVPFSGFGVSAKMSDSDLAAALRETALKLRYELLLIGERHEPDLLRLAADRLERRAAP